MKKQTILLLAPALSLAATHAVQAEEANIQGQLTAGVAHVYTTDEAAKLGEYTGVPNDSTVLIGSVDLNSLWGARYLNLNGELFGSDQNRLELEYGKFGSYELNLGFEQLPHVISTNARTPLLGAGGDNLALPAGFGQANTTGGMPLAGNLQTLNIETERENFDVRLAMTPDARWGIELFAKREEKDGVLPMGGMLATSGRWTSSAIIPAPIDYRVEDLGAALAFREEAYQLKLNYQYSRFYDDNSSVTWDNPFSSAGEVFPAEGRAATAPDNEYHNLTLEGGLDLPQRTRLTLVAQYAKMKQDENLLPYTINPLSVVGTALPRDSAEAEIDITHVTLNLASRIIPKLALNAKYRYYRSDNKTPMDLFLRVPNDTQNQAAANSSQASYNLPYEYTQNQFNLDGSYYFGLGTTLKLGFERDVMDREHRAVDETRENTYSAQLSSRYGDKVSGNINYAHARRRGDSYEESAVFNAMHTAAYIATVAVNEQFDTHPNLRQKDIADRNRDKYGFTVNVLPTETTTVSLIYNRTDDHFVGDHFGLDASDYQSITLDANYSPKEGMSLYGFYTKEYLDSEIESRSFDSAGPPGTKFNRSQDPTRDWQAEIEDDIDTIGLGGKLSLLGDKLTLDARYTFSEAENAIDFKTGATLAPSTDLPEDTTRRHTVEVEGIYQLSKHVDLGLGLMYERFDAENWQRDNWEGGSAEVDQLLSLVGPEEDYDAFTTFLTASYKW